MTPEQEKRFKQLFVLFQSEGWKVFQEEVQNKYANLRNDMCDQPAEKWAETKGYIYGLGFSLAFEELVKNVYENQTDEGTEGEAA